MVCIATSHNIGEEVAFIYNIMRFFRDNEARRGNMMINKVKLSVYLTHKQFNNRFTQHFSPKGAIFLPQKEERLSYKLVIAEKPSVAQSIAKVIGADKREDGYLEARRRNQNDK